VAPYFFDPSKAQELTPFRVTGRTQQEVWSSLDDYDLRSSLQTLQIPALLLQGENDVIPAANGRTLARLLRGELHLHTIF